MSPPLPTTIGFCDSRSTTIVAVQPQHAPVASRLLEPIDDDGARERNLGVRELQQLLADDLRREEALRLIGQVVVGIQPLALPAADR